MHMLYYLQSAVVGAPHHSKRANSVVRGNLYVLRPTNGVKCCLQVLWEENYKKTAQTRKTPTNSLYINPKFR